MRKTCLQLGIQGSVTRFLETVSHGNMLRMERGDFLEETRFRREKSTYITKFIFIYTQRYTRKHNPINLVTPKRFKISWSIKYSLITIVRFLKMFLSNVVLLCVLYRVTAYRISACTKKNEEYTLCGNRCPATCINIMMLRDGVVQCPSRWQCHVGCRCSPGFIRDEFSKDCVRPKNCPG